MHVSRCFFVVIVLCIELLYDMWQGWGEYVGLCGMLQCSVVQYKEPKRNTQDAITLIQQYSTLYSIIQYWEGICLNH